MRIFFNILKPILLLTLGIFLVFITEWPATWLADQVNIWTQGRVVLADAHGSIWQGNAILALRPSPNSHEATVLPGRLSWSVLAPQHTEHQFRLWHGLIRLEQQDVFPRPITVGISIDLLHPQTPNGFISAGQLQLPASWLDGLGMPFNTLRLNGQLAAEWNGFTFSSQQIQGEIRLHLQQLSSAISTVRPLGDYTAHLKFTPPHNSQLTLHTEAGPLFLEGSGSLNQGGFQGIAHADPEFEPTLRGLMSMLGRKNGDSYLLRY